MCLENHCFIVPLYNVIVGKTGEISHDQNATKRCNGSRILNWIACLKRLAKFHVKCLWFRLETLRSLQSRECLEVHGDHHLWFFKEHLRTTASVFLHFTKHESRHESILTKHLRWLLLKKCGFNFIIGKYHPKTWYWSKIK